MMQSTHLTSAITAAQTGDYPGVIQSLQSLNLDRVSERDREQILDLCLEVLAEGDFQEQWEIAKLLPKLGDRALTPLIDLLKDETNHEIEDRWFAARILGEFCDSQAIAALVDCLQSATELELTEMVVSALANIGTPAIVPLTELLDTSSRKLAVQVLAQIRHSHTIEPLLGVVEDPDPAIHTLAIEALGSFHDPQIPPLLMAKLTDVAASVRCAAVTALSMRGDLADELDLVPKLAPLLFDLNLNVCSATALGLSRVSNPTVVPILGRVLRSPHTPLELQSKLVLSLSWIATPTALDYLSDTLFDAPTVLALEIINQIGQIDREREYATKLLINFLRSPEIEQHSPIILGAIAAALGNLGDPRSVDELVKLLGEPDQKIKFQAICALHKISPDLPPQIRQLAAMSDIHPQLKIGIESCLAHWDSLHKL
jgi:HEAT repeat protein